jgi:hypothetical protein
MFFKFKKITSLFLILWLSVFTQLSVLHAGHSHDLLPLEQNMCDQDCADSTHRKAGESCEWFVAQRLVSYSESFLEDSSTSLLIFIAEVPKFSEIHYISPEHEIFSSRAPPIFSI